MTRDEWAACYARAFATDDGNMVLDDLTRRFPPDATRFFGAPEERWDPLRAAHFDGRAMVTAHIRGMLSHYETHLNRPEVRKP